MSSTSEQQAVEHPIAELRSVSIDRVSVRDGFNPRTDRDPKLLARTMDSVSATGILQPILVTPTEPGGDFYVVVAGEGRLRSAIEAGQREVPVIVRDVDERTGGLEWAMQENLAREDLDPVAQARGFDRLKRAGWSRKQTAEYFSIAQKLVTERLQILEIPSALHPKIASGEIPRSAVRPLVKLTKIHPALPAVLVARVLHGSPERSWEPALDWPAVVEDPIGALTRDYTGPGTELPDDVYVSEERYPASRFDLSERAQKHVAELTEVSADAWGITFGRDALTQALALRAAFPDARQWSYLIVGRDIASQLATDTIARQAKERRVRKRRLAAIRSTNAEAESETSGRVLTEEERAQERRQERERRMELQRAARAYNGDLGAAVSRHLVRLKVCDRVLKVLIATNPLHDLQELAARGARYGLPGWVSEEQTKTGKTKAVFLEPATCRTRALEFLAGAHTTAEIAGRVFCLIAMARYADPRALPISSRAGALSIGDALPWEGDVIDLIDEICTDRLPDHLIAPAREERRRIREDAEQAERERAAAETRVLDALQQPDGLDEDAYAAAVADVEFAFGRYSLKTHEVRDQLRAARATPVGSHADTGPGSETAPPIASTEDASGDPTTDDEQSAAGVDGAVSERSGNEGAADVPALAGHTAS